MAFEAFFLPAPNGQRFCLLHRPDAGQAARGAVVYVHPFGEEMNKSRRMAALQARALAAAGYTVLQIDLHGCGDSSGDFGDASWDDWIADVELACHWLQREGGAELWLWGLRTGCLLACVAAKRIESPCKLLLWQPVVSGKQYLQQFLRLKIAGELAGDGGDSKGKMERLREQLSRGEAVEIAGYRLSSGLADGLSQAELAPPESVARIAWLEISAKTDGALSPLADARIKSLQAGGCAANGVQVCGPAFWQTTEIEECPALVEATLGAMADAMQA
ncbi:MAG: hydrolase 2, exosortase A system-associated [Propionivibrio sp.]